MKKTWIMVAPLLAFMLAVPPLAAAQTIDNRMLVERLDRVERDIMRLSRQASGGGSQAPITGDLGDGVVAARVEARLVAVEERFRDFTGQIEQLQYQNETLKRELDRLREDMDYRLRALEGGATVTGTGDGTVITEEPKPLSGEETRVVEEPGTLSMPEQGRSTTSATSAQDSYNQAFRLLNQGRFADAQAGFRSFIDSHPEDPMIGNAYYWLGETYYVQRDYLGAADQFRQGYQVMKEGPKAPDNLLKLGMSLGNLGQKKEACVVYNQLLKTYGSRSAAVAGKAEQEKQRLGCR